MRSSSGLITFVVMTSYSWSTNRPLIRQSLSSYQSLTGRREGENARAISKVTPITSMFIHLFVQPLGTGEQLVVNRNSRTPQILQIWRRNAPSNFCPTSGDMRNMSMKHDDVLRNIISSSREARMHIAIITSFHCLQIIKIKCPLK